MWIMECHCIRTFPFFKRLPNYWRSLVYLNSNNLNDAIKLFDEFFRTSSGQITPIISLLPHPAMAKWPLLRVLCDYDTAEKSMNAAKAFIEPYITQHKETLDPNNIRDFMDLMLVEIDNTTDKNSSFYGQTGKNFSYRTCTMKILKFKSYILIKIAQM